MLREKRKRYISFSLISVSSVLVIYLVLVLACKGDSSKETAISDSSRATKNELSNIEQVEEIVPELQFKLVDKRIKDSAAQAALDLAYVASGDFTEGNLKSLVKKLFRDSQKMTGFKWYEHPTKIRIYLYASKDKVERGGYGFSGEYIATGWGGRVDNPQSYLPAGMMLVDFLVQKKREVEKYGGYMDEDGPRFGPVYGKKFGLGGIHVDLSILETIVAPEVEGEPGRYREDLEEVKPAEESYKEKVSQARQTTQGDYVGCITKELMENVMDYLLVEDTEAIQNLINSNLCFFIKEGIEVQIMDWTFFGLIKIRPMGENITFWTVSGAVEQATKPLLKVEDDPTEPDKVIPKADESQRKSDKKTTDSKVTKEQLEAELRELRAEHAKLEQTKKKLGVERDELKVEVENLEDEIDQLEKDVLQAQIRLLRQQELKVDSGIVPKELKEFVSHLIDAINKGNVDNLIKSMMIMLISMAKLIPEMVFVMIRLGTIKVGK